MNVISRKLLRDFYSAEPSRLKHAAAFEAWFKVARAAQWNNFQDARSTFGQTDVAKGDSGRTATIFDIGGNKYRVIAHVDYLRQTIKIEAVLTHAEYDLGKWKRVF